MKIKSRNFAIRLGVIAVLLSVIGASLVTYAAFGPYVPKTAAFAGFCWSVALMILTGTVYVAKTKP